MDYPPITVIITTCNRDHLLRDTVNSMRQNLYYSGQVFYLISADGNMPASDLFADIPDVIVIPGPNQGFGANLNNLIRNAKTDLVFQTCEDIKLVQPLYLDSHVTKLLSDETAGWIRLMWIGSHKYIGYLEGAYWRIDWNSPETYIPSCRSHLKHRRFHEYYGLYPEGLTSGNTEQEFCLNCIHHHNDTNGGPNVLVPLIGVLPDEGWHHTGVGADDLP